jgi:hypothetical protein
MSTAKKVALMVLLMFTCALPISAQSSPVADLPMLLRGTQPAVEVMINGKGPFLFAIDTGGGLQADIDTALVNQLKLPVNGKTSVSDPSGKNAREFDTVQVNSIALGGAEFRGITAVARDQRMGPNLPKVDGILGFPLFVEYLLTLDYPGKRVRLERGELAATNGSDILSFEMPHGIPVVELGVGNLKVRADIDSGNMMGGFIVSTSLAEKLNFASPPVTVGTARTISNEVEIKEVRLRDTIQLGRFEFPQPTVAYPSIVENANIGSRILREFALTFDQKNKRVKLLRTLTKSPDETAKSPSTERNEYAGSYGARSISSEDGAMFLQRQGGPKLKLIQVAPDEFTLEAVPGARIKFVRDGSGKIAELQVLNREGQWEGSKKDQL